jgi:tetratricopeptide (TPR) repeat protein
MMRENDVPRPRGAYIRIGRCTPRFRGPGVLLAGVAALAAGCATLPKADVHSRDDGRFDVVVAEAQSVGALAVTVYGDRQLAGALAEAAGIPPGEPIAAGTQLALPSKTELKERIAVAERARKLQAEGEEAQRKGEWEKAEARYREAMTLRPAAPELRQGLGVALLRRGKLEESLELLAQGSLLHPYDASTRYAYGAALREAGSLADALQELDAAVELDEHHARARYERARTLLELGETARARNAYREFLFAFPDDPWADEGRRRLDELDAP